MTDDLGALMRTVYPDAEAHTVPVDPPRCGMKRVVIGESDARGGYAVGPVYSDEAADELRELIEARGDICRGVVVLENVAEFRAETKRLTRQPRELKGCPSESAYRRHLKDGTECASTPTCREHMRMAERAQKAGRPLSGRKMPRRWGR